MDRERRWLPLLAALVAVVLWASAFIGIRAAGRAFSPGALALGRLLVGSLLLGGLQATRPFVRPTGRELALLLLAGLLWFGVYNVVLNDAERRVDAGTAAMLVLRRADHHCRARCGLPERAHHTQPVARRRAGVRRCGRDRRRDHVAACTARRRRPLPRRGAGVSRWCRRGETGAHPSDGVAGDMDLLRCR